MNAGESTPARGLRRPDSAIYVQVLLQSITERQRWREQYREALDNVSATGPAKLTSALDIGSTGLNTQVVLGSAT